MLFRCDCFCDSFRHDVDPWLQHFGYKLVGVEWREAFYPFAGADEAGGNFEFVLNCNHDSALAAAVELGHDQTGQSERLMKFARLTECVAASCRVNHE